MQQRYSVIVFDLGNTLINFDHMIAVRKVLERFSLDFKKLYNLFFDSDVTQAFEKGLITPHEFHKRVEAALSIQISYEDFVPIWNDIFWEDKPSCDLARQLKGSYKLFLLSNVNKLHFDYISEKFDILRIFDELILSYRLGAMKPERVVFDEAVKKGGGDPSKLLYIDDREEFVCAAKRFGIDGIIFEGANKLKATLQAADIL